MQRQATKKSIFFFRLRKAFVQAGTRGGLLTFLVIVVFNKLLTHCILAQEYPTRTEMKEKADELFGEPRNAKRLLPDSRIWVDAKRKLVIVDGYVALTEGQLEMFACPAGTKEHESVVAVFSTSRHVHTGLLAIGAKPGKPTTFNPYQPATGSTIKVYVLWRDKDGNKHTVAAQKWVRDVQHKKEMAWDWVFSGSLISTDPETKEEYYMADSGDLVCVSNFPTATMDIAVQSESSNAMLAYSAFTERIPPRFTVVRLVFQLTDAPPRTHTDASIEKSTSEQDGQPDPEKEKDTTASPEAKEPTNSSEKEKEEDLFDSFSK